MASEDRVTQAGQDRSCPWDPSLHVFKVHPRVSCSNTVTPEIGGLSITKAYRTRRSHSKSRFGCIPCKTRRIKCDASRPSCQKCRDKNVRCQYPVGIPGRGASRQNPSAIAQGAKLGPSPTIVPHPLWPGEKSPLVLMAGPESYSGTNQDLRLLHHFEISTSCTLGSSAILPAYNNLAVTLALEHAYLMHAVLAVAATHLRRLEFHKPDHRITEAYHWQCALSGFRRALRGPITRESSDSILLSSIFLNAMSFSFIEDDNLSPAESWIFSLSPRSLDWLSVQLGLRHLLLETRPFRMDSKLIPLFLSCDADHGASAAERAGKEGLSLEFDSICGLDETSNSDNNPYHDPLQRLRPLMSLAPSLKNLFKILDWFGSVDKHFFTLLQKKDPLALLIFGYWLGILCYLDQWWCQDRAKRECTAICMFLGLQGDARIWRLLEFPARACGYTLAHPSPNTSRLHEMLPGTASQARRNAVGSFHDNPFEPKRQVSKIL